MTLDNVINAWKQITGPVQIKFRNKETEEFYEQYPITYLSAKAIWHIKDAFSIYNGVLEEEYLDHKFAEVDIRVVVKKEGIEDFYGHGFETI